MDGGGLCHRGIVAAAIDVGNTAALNFQIGLGEFGSGLTIIGVGFSVTRCVVIVTITAAEEVAYHKHPGVDA